MGSTTLLATGRSRLSLVTRHAQLGLVAALLAATAAGCSSGSAPRNLTEAKQIAASCPEGRQIAGRAAIDVSGSRRAVADEDGRLDPVRDLVRMVAICGGDLRVDAFSGSSASTAAVYDGEPRLHGATDNARFRREPAVTDSVMAEVKKNLPVVSAKLPAGGTDISAQLGLSGEYKRQLDPNGSRYDLHLVITTDGVQTEGVSLTDPALTPDRAAQLAKQVSAPDLSGADVRLTDIGKVAGSPPSTQYIDALKAFYTALCAQTKAAGCVVVTDGAGR
ncbi:hypothetical protein NONI108955_22745 [Nocardia ninae]|uniref:Uncharacterized protein n=1 Tax=Nocardia ninae NBRC 108245 TaxID=1210091 RepID=A0A511MEI3_9NOCA|nr:hypothetical protein [Nocardia ninae]GEM38557.1 hypothetical protein NN4_30760 [Nocardia ninae NBRC 108245]